MNNDLETILDTCLNQIEAHAADIDECLARYPEEAAQLKPLLLAATTLSHARDLMPDPAYKARARTQLNMYMQQHPQRRRVSPVFWRFAVGAVTMLLVFFLASGTAFAQSALPGDALYNWKLTSEYVWRVTSSDPLATDLAISNRRLNELVAVANSGDDERRARALENYEQFLVRFSTVQDEKDLERIVPVLRSQHESLIQAGVSIPELEIYFPR
jgi:hypothetical protein